MPHLAEDEVVFDLLGRVEACSFGGLVVVECHFDPVLSSFVDAALTESVLGEVSVHDDGALKYIRGCQSEVGVFSRVVFAYVRGRNDPLIFG